MGRERQEKKESSTQGYCDAQMNLRQLFRGEEVKKKKFNKGESLKGGSPKENIFKGEGTGEKSGRGADEFHRSAILMLD